MAENVSSFKAHLSRGVEHLAESDIETIRDLLDLPPGLRQTVKTQFAVR